MERNHAPLPFLPSRPATKRPWAHRQPRPLGRQHATLQRLFLLLQRPWQCHRQPWPLADPGRRTRHVSGPLGVERACCAHTVRPAHGHVQLIGVCGDVSRGHAMRRPRRALHTRGWIRLLNTQYKSQTPLPWRLTMALQLLVGLAARHPLVQPPPAVAVPAAAAAAAAAAQLAAAAAPLATAPPCTP